MTPEVETFIKAFITDWEQKVLRSQLPAIAA